MALEKIIIESARKRFEDSSTEKARRESEALLKRQHEEEQQYLDLATKTNQPFARMLNRILKAINVAEQTTHIGEIGYGCIYDVAGIVGAATVLTFGRHCVRRIETTQSDSWYARMGDAMDIEQTTLQAHQIALAQFTDGHGVFWTGDNPSGGLVLPSGFTLGMFDEPGFAQQLAAYTVPENRIVTIGKTIRVMHWWEKK